MSELFEKLKYVGNIVQKNVIRKMLTLTPYGRLNLIARQISFSFMEDKYLNYFTRAGRADGPSRSSLMEWAPLRGYNHSG